jgi:hypothetical protein
MTTRLADLHKHLVGDAEININGDASALSIAQATRHAYADAQLDDYSGARPFVFCRRPPLRLSLEARFSHRAGMLKGTAGFGFWNHPFGPGGGVIPRSIWFFYGSPESDMRFARNSPGQGFRAAMLDALPPWRRASPLTSIPKPATASAGIDQPQSVLFRLADRLARSRLLVAAGVRIAQRVFRAHEQTLNIDITTWHRYEIEWLEKSVCWRVNGQVVMRCAPPPGPLGFVAWIDNYVAQFSLDGRYGFAYVATPAIQSMEIRSFALDQAHT